MKKHKNREKLPNDWQNGDGPVSVSDGVKISYSKNRHHRDRWISMTTMAFLTAFAATAAVSCYGFPTPIQAQLDIHPGKYTKKGTLREGEKKEVEVGDFRVMLDQLPTMEAGSRDCNIKYENPEEDHYSVRISLYLEETGRLIGGTTRVDPGYYMESIRLKKSLPVGEYPATVRIELFDNKTPAGETSITITLRIIEPQEGEIGRAINEHTQAI